MAECLFILILPFAFRKRVSLNNNKAMENTDKSEMQETQAAKREMLTRYYEKHFLQNCGQTPEEFAQRDCGSSIPRDTQSPAGCIPENNLTSRLVLPSTGVWSR